MTRKHNHYFKPTPFESADVYRVLLMFNVTDPCFQHAIKKLLVAGGRGAGKDVNRDVQEAIDTLQRWQEIQTENAQFSVQATEDPGAGSGITSQAVGDQGGQKRAIPMGGVLPTSGTLEYQISSLVHP